MRNLLALLIASAGLVGCVGSIDPPDGPVVIDPDTTTTTNNPSNADLSAAKALYDTTVHSILVAKCSGAACHSDTASGATLTRFVASDASKGWDVATGYVGLVGNFTTSAPILTKLSSQHQGKTYEATEKDAITKWLAKEVELRNGQTNTPTGGGETLSAAADRVMSQFAGCMKLADFQATNMAAAWANINSNEGQCKRCHVNGESSFIANQDAPTAFSVIGSKKMYWLQYFTVDLSGGAAAAKVTMNGVSIKGVSNRTAPHTTHPTFTYPNNAGVAALQQFYDKTIANVAAGGCAPKALENI
jgi:hypothetical protein